MAAGNFTPFGTAKLKMLSGVINLSSDTFNAILLSNAAAANCVSTFTGASGSCEYSDIAPNEVSGTGYTAGGQTLTGVSLTLTGNTVSWTSAAPSWTSATITAQYMAIYDNTDTSKHLVGFMQLDSQADSSTNGTFTVSPNASGWFKLQ